ncbi:MAG TPA: Clp protease N-terminal domain-containing protein, partial [Holophagaceae bacterium]|nr:Clp protease N-terminal domain-containing protein [Holophagaceae bacterium]
MSLLPLTQKANEALVSARDGAQSQQHPELLPLHLLSALLEPASGLRPLLEGAGAQGEAISGLLAAVDEAL